MFKSCFSKLSSNFTVFDPLFYRVRSTVLMTYFSRLRKKFVVTTMNYCVLSRLMTTWDQESYFFFLYVREDEMNEKKKCLALCLLDFGKTIFYFNKNKQQLKTLYSAMDKKIYIFLCNE